MRTWFACLLLLNVAFLGWARLVDRPQPPPLEASFGSAGRVRLDKGERCVVVISTDGAQGLAHADAVLLVPVP